LSAAFEREAWITDDSPAKRSAGESKPIARYGKESKMRATVALLFALTSLPLTPSQNATIKKLEGRLMAPCCYTQTILDHDSQEAAEMREEVTAMVAAGKSEAEIVTYYRTKYGETILVVPDGVSGHLLTFTPPLLFLAACGLLFLFVRRSVRDRKFMAAPEALVEESSRLLAIIREETGELL